MQPFVLIDQDDSSSIPNLRGYAERALMLEHPSILAIANVLVRNDGRWRLVVPAMGAGWSSLSNASDSSFSVLDACSIVFSLADAYAHLRTAQLRGCNLVGAGYSVQVRSSIDELHLCVIPPNPSMIEADRVAVEQWCGRSEFYASPEWRSDNTEPAESVDSFSLGAWLLTLIPGQPVGQLSGSDLCRLVSLKGVVGCKSWNEPLESKIVELLGHSLAAQPHMRPSLAEWESELRDYGAIRLESHLGKPTLETIPEFADYCRVLGVRRSDATRSRSWIMRRTTKRRPGPEPSTEPSDDAYIPEEIRKRAQPRVTRPATDAVDCTVYAPATSFAGDLILVQAFFHVPEKAAEARRLAKEFDDEAQRRGFKSLELDVAHGTKLQAELKFPGLEVDEPVQYLMWRGRTDSVQFVVSVPERKPGSCLGKLTVYMDGVPVGKVTFKIKIEASRHADAIHDPSIVRQNAHPFQQAFISYASEDRAEVLKRVQMIDRFQLNYFQDLLSLESGQEWEPELYRRIEECDLFLLFWSSASKGSQWVMAEVEYALSLQGTDEFASPDIVPIIIEGPPVPLPPKQLEHLHFNDRLIYFMR